MVNSASPWQHTVIPLDTAISRRADASLNAPFVRLWQAFLSGRVFLALALILLQALNLQLQSISSPLVWLICIVYLILTTVLRLLAGKHLPAPRAALQWLPVIGVDIAVIFLLQISQVGSLNYSALLAIPILFLGMRSLNGLGPVRKWVAIVVRLLVLACFILIIGGIRFQRTHKDVEVMVVRDISISTRQVRSYPGQSLQQGWPKRSWARHENRDGRR